MQALTLHRVDRALLDEAIAAFKPPAATPETTHAELMFQAGQQDVLRWLEIKLAGMGRKADVAGITAEEVEMPHTEEGFLRKISKGL